MSPMPSLQRLACLLSLLAGSGMPFAARAAIDAHQLGARYDVTASNIAFRVYSSKATRWPRHLPAPPRGAATTAASRGIR